ncbi:cutinase family protein [Candidatus Saccharibacteria bacterium]|nr:cutinase family protein [Candidatus Saccharibacteria bacterium]
MKNTRDKIVKLALLIVPIMAIFALLSTSPRVYGGVCDDVKFIFARGSGLSPNSSKEFLAFNHEIETILKTAHSSFKYSIFDLGSDATTPDPYPAIDILPGFNSDFLKNTSTALGAFVSAGEYFKYGASVDAGVAELLGNIRDTLTSCPRTRFVLGGFSQGAQVVGEALSRLTHFEQNAIIYSALFGDPKLNLPEGRGLFPDACSGRNISVYNIWSPNCFVSSGILRAREPYLPANLLWKTGIWCNAADGICGNLNNIPFNGHSTYASDGGVRWAASIIRSRLLEYFSTEIGGGQQIWADNYDPITRTHNELSSPRDISILLDLEGINSIGELENIQSQIIGFVQLLPSDGNTFVWFRNTNPRIGHDCTPGSDQSSRTSIGCISNHFRFLINNPNIWMDIEASPTNFGDHFTNQSIFLPWRQSTTRSIVVFTNEPKNSTLSSSVFDSLHRTTDIQFYSNHSLGPLVDSFIHRTNGFISDYADLAEAVFRPHLHLSPNDSSLCPTGFCNIILPTKTASVDQPILFEVKAESVSAPISHYEWDLTGNGLFDRTTLEPFITSSFSQFGTFFPSVRVVDNLGRSSRLSWRVYINSTAPSPPITPDNIVENLYFTPNNDLASGVLTWETTQPPLHSPIPDGLLLRLNGFVLGTIDLSAHRIEIENLDFSILLTFSLSTKSGNTFSNSSAEISAPLLKARPNPVPAPEILNPIAPTRPQTLLAPQCSLRCR